MRVYFVVCTTIVYNDYTGRDQKLSSKDHRLQRMECNMMVGWIDSIGVLCMDSCSLFTVITCVFNSMITNIKLGLFSLETRGDLSLSLSLSLSHGR